MVEPPHSDSEVRLQCGRLLIVGMSSNTPEWYEFEVFFDGATLGKIGAEKKTSFKKHMLSILDNKAGIKMSTIENGVFRDLVGGDDVEYVGNLPLSSCNTFYFFRRDPLSCHVVLADSRGSMLAHSPCSAQAFDGWRRQLTDS